MTTTRYHVRTAPSLSPPSPPPPALSLSSLEEALFQALLEIGSSPLLDANVVSLIVHYAHPDSHPLHLVTVDGDSKVIGVSRACHSVRSLTAGLLRPIIDGLLCEYRSLLTYYHALHFTDNASERQSSFSLNVNDYRAILEYNHPSLSQSQLDELVCRQWRPCDTRLTDFYERIVNREKMRWACETEIGRIVRENRERDDGGGTMTTWLNDIIASLTTSDTDTDNDSVDALVSTLVSATHAQRCLLYMTGAPQSIVIALVTGEPLTIPQPTHLPSLMLASLALTETDAHSGEDDGVLLLLTSASGNTDLLEFPSLYPFYHWLEQHQRQWEYFPHSDTVSDSVSEMGAESGNIARYVEYNPLHHDHEPRMYRLLAAWRKARRFGLG